jgi:23S rRNA (cytosine1962-C5)-methyltransferase
MGILLVDSQIKVRMIAFSSVLPGDWLERGIRDAYGYRQGLVAGTDAYRLVNAEGDFLPGLTVDVYGKTTVIRPLVKGMELLLERATAALAGLYPDNAVYLRRDEFTARKEDIQAKNGYLKGEGDGFSIIEENGLKFRVDIAAGQKTGFYLDQRDNRFLTKSLAKGRKVLNLFSYTAAFSLYAAAGGATSIVSVDSSQGALNLAGENLKLNPELEPNAFSFACADVFEYLKDCEQADLLIVDPPPFARKKQEVEGAVKGYKFINGKAIEKLAPGGLLLSFSCSQAVSRADFTALLVDVCQKSRRTVRLVRELGVSFDHPMSPFHSEGEYLKGWVLHAS